MSDVMKSSFLQTTDEGSIWIVTTPRDTGDSDQFALILTADCLLQAPYRSEAQFRQLLAQIQTTGGNYPPVPKSLQIIPLQAILKISHTPAYDWLEIVYRVDRWTKTLKVSGQNELTCAEIFMRLRQRVHPELPAVSQRVRFEEVPLQPGHAAGILLILVALAGLIAGASGEELGQGRVPILGALFFMLGRLVGPVIAWLLTGLIGAAGTGCLWHLYTHRPEKQIVRFKQESKAAEKPAWVDLALSGLPTRVSARAAIIACLVLAVGATVGAFWLPPLLICCALFLGLAAWIGAAMRWMEQTP